MLVNSFRKPLQRRRVTHERRAARKRLQGARPAGRGHRPAGRAERRAQAPREGLRRALPVSQREDAVVPRQPHQAVFPLLRVQGERERLIPFTEEAVKHVDVANGVIRVDWQADY